MSRSREKNSACWAPTPWPAGRPTRSAVPASACGVPNGSEERCQVGFSRTFDDDGPELSDPSLRQSGFYGDVGVDATRWVISDAKPTRTKTSVTVIIKSAGEP